MPLLPSSWSFFILLFYLFYYFGRGDAGRNDGNWNKHKLLEGSGSFRMVIPIRPERNPPTPRPLSLPHLSRSSFISRCREFKSRDRVLLVFRSNGIRVFKADSCSRIRIVRLRVLFTAEKKLSKQVKYSNRQHHALFTLRSREQGNREINFETRWCARAYRHALALWRLWHMHINDVCIFSRIICIWMMTSPFVIHMWIM